MDINVHVKKGMEVLGATLISMNVLVLLVRIVDFVSINLVHLSVYAKQDTVAIDVKMVSKGPSTRCDFWPNS